MNNASCHISEADLKKSICQLKNRRDHSALVKYLVGVISTGRVPARLQAKAYNELGLAHLQLEEPLEAEKAFLSAVERDPRAVNPRFNRANLAIYAQKYTQAFELFQEILDIDPQHVGAMFHAGLCLAMTDQPSKALPYFESSAKAAPEAMGPNFWAGETMLAQKRFQEALSYFLKAADITPEHTESLRGIAICRFELGQYQECVDQCNALILSGGGAEFLACRIKGDACIEMGEIEAAALCHLELADMDFDARDYLVMRASELARQHSLHVARYIAVIIDVIPELERAFAGLTSNGEAAAAQ